MLTPPLLPRPPFPPIRYLVASDDEFDAVVPSAEDVMELEVHQDAFHSPFIGGESKASFADEMITTNGDAGLHDLGDLSSSDDDNGCVHHPIPSPAHPLRAPCPICKQ